VRVINDDKTVVIPGHFDDFREAGDVAFHRIDAFHDDHLRDGVWLRQQDVLKILGIVVAKALYLGVGKFDPGPERRMHIAIDQDEVTLLSEAGHGSHAGEVSCGEDLA